MLFVSHLCRSSSIRALVVLFFCPILSILSSICQLLMLLGDHKLYWPFCILARMSHTSFISIFPPVCRNIAKQTFLETLQDNLIEMDILASARHDASYNDGYVACLLSGSDYCQDLLCHENNRCLHYFPSSILCFETLSIICVHLLQCYNPCCICPFPVLIQLTICIE